MQLESQLEYQDNIYKQEGWLITTNRMFEEGSVEEVVLGHQE